MICIKQPAVILAWLMARQDAAAPSNTKPIALVLILAVLFPSDSISASSPIASGGASKVLVARRFVRQVFDAPTLVRPSYYRLTIPDAKPMLAISTPHHAPARPLPRDLVFLWPVRWPRHAGTARLDCLRNGLAARKLPTEKRNVRDVVPPEQPAANTRAQAPPFPQHTLALALACDKMSLL